MKGIIYCRVSSQEQVRGTSLDSQQEACLKYAENNGIRVEKIFIEKGESATAADRTEFLKAIEFCRERKGDVGAFIVWKIDRFARNTTDHFAVRAQLLKYGATLHSVTELISQDPQGELMGTILAGFAQFENEVRKQRCKGGMERKLKEGISCWQPPIGYLSAKKLTDRRKTQPDEPDPERFLLIQKALKTYATGEYTILALTALMNQWGLRTRTGKPMFIQLAERMLRDKFYAGILENPWNDEEYQGKHEPMITLEEYEQIQHIKRSFSRLKDIRRRIVHPDFPLRRTIFCACHERVTASWRKGRSKHYAYYSCNNKQCQHYSHGIPKMDLEKKFVEFLNGVKPTPQFLKVFRTVVLGVWKNQRRSLEQERKHYEGQLMRLENQKEQLLQMRMSGEISRDEFTRHKENLDGKITGIRISRNETKTDELDMEAAIAYVEQFISNIARQWQDIKDAKQKQRLQKLVLPEGITFDKITQTFGTAVLSPVFLLSRDFAGDESHLVAGTGIAPVSQGYEPREVLLLHPAKPLYAILFGL